MSAHTPGPWPIEAWSAGDSRGWYVRLGTDDNAQRIDVYEDTQSSESDARLIAAAPDAVELLRDLLNAHEGAVNVSDDPFPDDLDRSREWLERIHAVLATVEGKS